MKRKLPRVSFSSRRSRTPTAQVLIVTFVLLFVLFLWLNFVLMQQTESIGRDMQAKAEQLKSLQRQGDAYRQEIAIKASQLNMAERARLLGYQPQAPLFLPISEPLAEPVSEAPVGQTTTLASGVDVRDSTANPLWLLLTGQLLGPESRTAP